MTAAPASSIAILIVEHRDDDHALLRHRIESPGRRTVVMQVRDASELHEALARTVYDIVIAGPGLSTTARTDALARLRELDPDLPFLIVTGTGGEELAVEAMRAGADDYLLTEKLGRLMPAIERAIERATNRRRLRRAEAALKESETRFAALAANLPGMVFQMQLGGGGLSLLYVSEGSYRVLGVAPHELLATPSLFFDALAAAGAEELRETLTGIAANSPHVKWERALPAMPGREPRTIEIAARSRTLAAGAMVWDGIVTDITAAKGAQQELRELASHLTRAREEEREALARELHDDVGSTLTAAKFELAWLKNATREVEGAAARWREVDRLVDAVIVASSRITHDLRPGILDEGIVASLEWQTRSFEQRMGISCAFQSSREEIALDPESALAMFRVCQEALNNIAKHAHATRVDVRLDSTDDALMLEIHDNGRGISAADLAKRSCFGLRGMRERADSLGGEIEIRNDRDGGTTVAFSLFPEKPLVAAGREP